MEQSVLGHSNGKILMINFWHGLTLFFHPRHIWPVYLYWLALIYDTKFGGPWLNPPISIPEYLRPHLGNTQTVAIFIIMLIGVLICALFFTKLWQKQYKLALVYFLHVMIIYKLSSYVHFFAFHVLEKVIIE